MHAQHQDHRRFLKAMKGDVVAGANEHERSPGVVRCPKIIVEAVSGSCFVIEIAAKKCGNPGMHRAAAIYCI
jgi:hypothetical protein